MGAIMNGRAERLDGSDWITSDGYRSLCDDLDRLVSLERPDALEQVRMARLDGELADNPGLMDMLDHQARIEQRITQLRSRIARARVARVDDAHGAGIGMQVMIRDAASQSTMTVELVGEHEADADHDRISIASPVGAAIMGLPVGGVGTANTPQGPRTFEVLQLRAAVSTPR
jgi:transcription elongation factor GreA